MRVRQLFSVMAWGFLPLSLVVAQPSSAPAFRSGRPVRTALTPGGLAADCRGQRAGFPDGPRSAVRANGRQLFSARHGLGAASVEAVRSRSDAQGLRAPQGTGRELRARLPHLRLLLPGAWHLVGGRPGEVRPFPGPRRGGRALRASDRTRPLGRAAGMGARRPLRGREGPVAPSSRSGGCSPRVTAGET